MNNNIFEDPTNPRVQNNAEDDTNPSQYVKLNWTDVLKLHFTKDTETILDPSVILERSLVPIYGIKKLSAFELSDHVSNDSQMVDKIPNNGWKSINLTLPLPSDGIYYLIAEGLNQIEFVYLVNIHKGMINSKRLQISQVGYNVAIEEVECFSTKEK